MSSLLFVLFFGQFAINDCNIVLRAPGKIQNAMDIFNDASEIVTDILKIFNLVDQSLEAPRMDFRSEMNIFDKFDDLTIKLDGIKEELAAQDASSAKVFERIGSLAREMKLDLGLHSMMVFQTNIDNYYLDYTAYTINWYRYENETILDFANKIVEHDQSSVAYSMKHIHAILFPEVSTANSRESILEILFNETNKLGSALFCANQQSAQEMINKFFRSIISTELKTINLISFAYSMKKLYRQGNYTGEMEKSLREFKIRMDVITNKMRQMIARASTERWNCDVKTDHVLGETYDEITNFIQGYILNEENLDDGKSCLGQCSSELFRHKKIAHCDDNWCKTQKRCNTVLECDRVADSMNVCESNQRFNKTRRYDYVTFDNQMTFGRKHECNEHHLEKFKEKLFWDCDYCFCTCETYEAISDRYISLRAAMANIKENRVVTGIRFIKHNRIIHLQVRDGILLPRLKINMTSNRWVPVEDYKITDSRINRGQDYVKLTTMKRSFDLDDLKAPKGHVVTGVRFRMIGEHINLEMCTTPVDFHRGVLKLEQSVYDGSLKTVRSEITLVLPDVPIRIAQNGRRSPSGTYVRFQPTDKIADGAQSTVPFFDVRPVVTTTPTPLGGLGVFHRGTARSGGFIAPKIFTYDFTPHVRQLMDEY